nr:DUF2304 domain-containing protein [uncultured Acetatifactor sp.]
MDGTIIRIGLIAAGIILIVFGFWTHSIKKLAVNYAVIWGLLGIVMILVGAIPVLSEWTAMMAPGTGLAFFCVGALILFTEVQESLVISQLNLKNRELAMQVSLLNRESERMMLELEELVREQEEAYAKKDSVRD